MPTLFRLLVTLLVLSSLTFAVALADEPDATICREDNPAVSRELGIPIYAWQCSDPKPRAIVLAIHGTSLHGGTFDILGKELAAQGFSVFAPDLHGFGRWQHGDQNFGSKDIDFFKSRADMIRILNVLHRDNPGIPIFSMGESVGANLSLWIASVAPDLVSGVIASGTCVRRKKDYCPAFFIDGVRGLAFPHAPVNVKPYARRFLSERPDVISAYLSDPYMRKTMCLVEGMASLHVNHSTLWFAGYIPADMPILVISGLSDRMFYQLQTDAFLTQTPKSDCTFFHLPGKGHIQLETPFVTDDVRDEIAGWLTSHSKQETVAFKNKVTPIRKPDNLARIEEVRTQVH